MVSDMEMEGMVFYEPMTASLLLQHKALAATRIEFPRSQGKDANEQMYRSVLLGLGNASKISARHTFKHFSDWESEISSSRDPRKKLLMSQMFYESLRQIVDSGGETLQERQFDAMERWAIDWILLADRDHTMHDYKDLKDAVTHQATLLIGTIANYRLSGITQKYLREVEERLPKDTNQSRQEIKQLCEGMQQIQLASNTTAQLDAATDFLRRCDPLKHTAPQRKSYIHHTMCEMLTAIISHMTNDDRPRRQLDSLDPKAVANFQATARKLRADIASWTRQSKHILVAYPLITHLFSLEDFSNFERNVDSQMDLILRHLRDKDRRTMALGCVATTFQGYLTKVALSARPADVNAFLARHTKVLLSHLKKGSLHQQEQQEILVTICVIIAENAPEFGLGNLLAELLGDTAAWDVIIIGLKALYRVIMDVPKRLRNQNPSRKSDNLTVSDSLAEIIRQGDQVLSAYGVPQLTAVLSQLLNRVIIAAFNNAGQPPKSKTPMEILPAPGLVALRDALSCIPYILPEPWSSRGMLDDLASQTLHQSDFLRIEATDVLKRIMSCLPSRRNEVVVAIAAFAVRVPDEPFLHQENLKRTLSLLLGLLSHWIIILDERQRGEIQEADQSQSRRLDLHRLEGIAVAILCVNSADLRKQALEVLRILRTLHRSLLASSRIVDAPGEVVNYLYTIIENIGNEKAHQCYWDFCQWSELWGTWRPVKDERAPPSDATILQTLMLRTLTQEDVTRWTRTISEVIKAASRLSPKTANAAYHELTSRALLHLVKEPVGRAPYILSMVDGEQWRVDLVCIYSMAALACPPQPAAKSGISSRELIVTLLTAIRAGIEAHQQMLINSVGYCNQECAEMLLDELQPLVDEYLNERSKVSSHPHFLQGSLLPTPTSARKQTKSIAMDSRIQVAQITRLLAGNAQPRFLHQHPSICRKLLDFIVETKRFLGSQPEASWLEIATIKYCMCCVVRALCMDFIGSSDPALSTALRGSIFETISGYCLEGSKGQSRSDMLKASSSARSKPRSDLDVVKLDSEISDTADNLEHMTHLAMASLLWGPAFEADISKTQSKALVWIENMLTSEVERGLTTDSERLRHGRSKSDGRFGPAKDSVARTALKNLVSTNPQALNVTIDQCYSRKAAVARAYFQVLVEVYASKDLDAEPQILLSLVLYKMVDPQLEVRDDALHMLRVLSMRVWKEGLVPPRPDTDPSSNTTGTQEEVAVVVGNLQDTYQQFQYHVSAKLAREHPEISEGLCIEMMTRQLAASLADARFHSLQHHILTALTPWMENITFRLTWKGNWSERLMKSMYYVTQQHGVSFPHEIERLWCTVAANKRNVIPILEFLISRATHEAISQDSEPALSIFDVEKRISLYLARTSPQQTIDHLLYEITQLIEADDEPVTAHKPASLVEFEFHDPERSSPSRQSSHSSSHHSRSWHAKQPSMSQHPSIGHSGLTDLSAMPSSLITEFMPDVSQMPGEGHRMSDLIRSVSSARQNVAESLPSIVSEASGRLPSRIPSIPALATPPARGPLMRAEVAVCLLAEIAYEHDEDFRGHLPLLFHSMLLLMDSTDSLVFRHAQQVITHLLYSLSVRHLELHRAAGAMLAEYEKVTSLLTYLQAMRGKRLWNYEDVSMQHIALSSAFALTALTSAIVESIFFEKDIKERWAQEALKWMLDSNSRHLACRSHQIFRALRPAPTSTAFIAMLTCLEKCLALSTQLSLEVAVEIIMTLQVMVENLEPAKMLLFPQLFLACLTLLPTTFKHVYALVIDLFQKILEKMELNDTTTQHIILAASPTVAGAAMPQLFGFDGRSVTAVGWPLAVHLYGLNKGSQLMCVQQLLVKGLFKPETELCTIEALACLADQIACLRRRQNGQMVTVATLVFDFPGSQTFMTGLGSLLGEVETQLALSIISQLPWLCQHFRYSVHAGLAGVSVLAHARACRAAGYSAMGDALVQLRRNNPADLSVILEEVCGAYTKAFFPRYAKLALQRLMENILKGHPSSHGSVLQILCAIFKARDLDLGSAGLYTSEEGLLSPVARLIQGEHSAVALEVINAISVFRASKESSDDSSPVTMDWPKAISVRHASDAQTVVDSLGRLNESWSQSSRETVKGRIMPFLPTQDFHTGKPLR